MQHQDEPVQDDGAVASARCPLYVAGAHDPRCDMRSRSLLAASLLLSLACRPAFEGELTSEDRLDGAELLIIAPAETIDGFEDFVAWKRALGIPTRLEAMEDIDAAESGEDLTARIRARIQRAVADEGTRWVVLGADAPLLPVRKVYTWVNVDFEGAYYEDSIATDLYYADLDGDWDGDGDGAYAEPDDGMDLLPEVAIGRVPARSAAQVQDYTDKLFLYERWPEPDYQQTGLMLGEWAGEVSGLEFYSSTALESWVVPLFPEDFEITRLYEAYEAHEGAIDNTTPNQIAAFEAGHNLILNFGHGVASYIGNLSLSNIWNLVPSGRPAIFTTTECSGCDFENEYVDHSACEAYVLGSGGGVAYLGNTHVGIGFPSLLNFYVAFFEEVFEDSEQLSLGERVQAVQASYTTPEALAEEGHPDRWSAMVMVLMGDPSMVPWRVTPRAPELGKVSWYRHADGEVGCYEVTLDGQPVQGAVVTWTHADDLQVVATTDAQGEACLLAPKGSPRKAALTVSGPDLLPVERDQKL